MNQIIWSARVIVILLVLAAAAAVSRADDQIDMNTARSLFLKQRNGETLSADEQMYLDKAKAVRRAERGGGRKTDNRNASRQKQGRNREPRVGRTRTGQKPLCEMTASDTYKGEDGGLYGGGNNAPPEALRAAAMKEIAQITPLDSEGKPSPDGKIVLLSIGMSNTTQEFSAFKQAIADDPRKSPSVMLLDGAQGGKSSSEWTVNKPERTWQELDRRLRSAGIQPAQIQVLWLKQAKLRPERDTMQNARVIRDQVSTILQMAKARFPNLRVAYLSSRTYGGYSGRHPEPESFETAFSVRWLIRDQMAGVPELNWDDRRGEVNAPLLLWGPYLWADGIVPRVSDGLIWTREDFRDDGTHPSESGKKKVVKMLIDFFTSDPCAEPWFVKH